jgi:cytochrome c-type biogenesis protein
MFENLFEKLYYAVNELSFLAILASFLWGILSILLSPCHLSSIALIVSYISAKEITSLKKTFIVSSIFSIGTLLTIAVIGTVSALLGRLMGDIGSFGNYLVAAIFLIVGLYLMDIIKLDWSGVRLSQSKKISLWTPLLLGLLFGFALGPCTFAYMAPVLGAVFQTAQTNLPFSISLLFSFAIGNCSIIIAIGTLTGKVQSYLIWSQKTKIVTGIKRFSGFLVFFGGVYLILNQIGWLQLSFF